MVLMVPHSVINKVPKGFWINIIFSHRKSHSELFRMVQKGPEWSRMVLNGSE